LTGKRGGLAFQVAAVSLFLASLACKTILAPEEIFVPTPTPSATPPPSPTPFPTPASRLNGEDLPEINPGPPGESPRNRNRPRLSGAAQTLDTQHFRIHYTLSGEDAVPPEDANGNQHPDYVEDVARAMEYSWFAEIEHFGWTAPPSDGTLGGDGRYDVYLENVFDEDIAGYTEGGYEETMVGDNPNSESVETNASSSFIALDNDYAEYAEAPYDSITTLDYMRSTAAHEFTHAIQYGYDAFEPHEWLWEATATWMQEEVFDSVNDANEALQSVFKSPDSCHLAYGGDERVEDSDHWYGLWIFLRYLSENYGHTVVRQLWENAIELDGYAIWDKVLTENATNMDDFFRRFSVAVLSRDFQEGPAYTVVRLEGEAGMDERFNPADGVAQLAADYIEVLAEGRFTVTLENSQLEGLLVGIRGGESSLFPLAGGSTSIDGDQFENMYLIVMNLARAARENQCRVIDYTFTITAGGDPVSPSEVLAAPNFRQPTVEGLLDPEEFLREDAEPRD
jgi:hypothetical protein